MLTGGLTVTQHDRVDDIADADDLFAERPCTTASLQPMS